ncbi:MAG: hypothetical protein NC218_08495 [Acetobacter sp.]|nr:hypothetical protein [Acetobacter sp.]
MLFYKLELTPSNMINVIDIVEEKRDDEFIYATEEEFKKLKQSRVINYIDDLSGGAFGSFHR